ncbi:MAG: phospholipase D-like domain-containing protein [Candidatus Micrarchaeaceae archaeon]
MFSSEPYSGPDSFKFVERLFRRERRLLISSPYICAYYAKMLLRISSRKRIYLITSKEPKSNAEALKYLSRKNPFRLWAYLAAIAAVPAFFASIYLSAAFLLLAIALFAKKSNLRIKFASASVHEKLYIGENEAIVGSANLTYSGMHSNIEHIEIIKDKEEIEKITRHFYKLWNSI